MKQSLLAICCVLCFSLNAQDIEDPSLRKPASAIIQTGIALQWFDKDLKSFSLSAERPVNLYNHIGFQVNLFFPSYSDYSYDRNIDTDSYEVGFFAKCFFHGRLTGRRSKTYYGPDLRFGQFRYIIDNPFEPAQRQKSNIFKFMVRLGWQFHLGPSVLELALPFGLENEVLKNEIPNSTFYYNDYNETRFVMSPSFSLGFAIK